MHPFGVGTSHGQPWTHLTHHGLDSREATTFPHIVFSMLLHGGFTNGTFSRDSQGGVLKLSRVELPGLWELISPSSDLRLEWGLNQSCSSPWELSNALSHSFCELREEVDSRLLVVGSQTTNLTPIPSFAHNLSFRCSNGSCEAILDIYTSRPFQRYKEHPNVRCFDPCNQALSFQESRRTPSSHFWECEFHPHT
jgi:hypothetical protein